MSDTDNGTEITTDVLVIGGGMAAAWAAISAARQGVDVVLVDKGFVGTSGVTATGGPNHWWVAPDGDQRRDAIERRHATSGGLADRAWMARIIDHTWRLLPQLAPYYPFGPDGRGGTFYSGLRGPEYMRALRRFAIESGVRILDHHPALELLVRDDGRVAGASGYARIGSHGWTARAGAVVMATGGCAFRSGLIGSHGNTGDGYLMAAEAGAELSGMEFSNAYSVSPAWNSTRTLPYPAARFYDADGREIDAPPPLWGPGQFRVLAAAMLEGPVYADLGDAPALLKTILTDIQPGTPPPFERKGVRLFEDRFEVRLFGEGTIRGTGGLRIIDEDCRTTVPGLYAAGDAATRELIAGATSGGGAQNSAWALTSGHISGASAALFARQETRGAQAPAHGVGRVGLHPEGTSRRVDQAGMIQEVREQVLRYDRALWRSEPALGASAQVLDGIWQELTGHLHGEGLDQVAARETAALLATARWCVAAARARKESRGMHIRADAPETDPGQAARLLTGGLDQVWTRFESVPDAGQLGRAAA